MACLKADDGGGKATYSRQVTFELTFAQSDLDWSGDPGSATAAVRVKAGAEPIATDVCVTTLTSDPTAPERRYYRDARIADENGRRLVYAFTRRRERMIGTVDDSGRFIANGSYQANRHLLSSWPNDPAALHYDPDVDALYVDTDRRGPLVSETLDFLPLEVSDAKSAAIGGHFSIDYSSDQSSPIVSLVLEHGAESIVLATASLPADFHDDDVRIGSFDNEQKTYLSEAAFRPGARTGDAEPSVTVTLSGEFTDAVETDGQQLLVKTAAVRTDSAVESAPVPIQIDGNFEDWRNVPGVDDPRGDSVPYLTYDPDVDLLELKVANDDAHIYLYARVAGQVGHCDRRGGRSYFYAYMDVDRDPGTGFLPSRDDECYYGVTIGDDCEVQFEFVDNRLLKTFYGFCGLGGNDNVLRQAVSLGQSRYGRFDSLGHERADYKVEYIYRSGNTAITKDLKPGTSDTIHLAISPSGHEVEVVSTLSGFLKNVQGKPTVGLGQSIDVAAGMERNGRPRWAADSTPPIRGYTLTPTSRTNR